MCQTGILSPNPLLYLLIPRPVPINNQIISSASGGDDFWPTVAIEIRYDHILRGHGIVVYEIGFPLSSGFINRYKEFDPDSVVFVGIAPSGNDLISAKSEQVCRCQRISLVHRIIQYKALWFVAHQINVSVRR